MLKHGWPPFTSSNVSVFLPDLASFIAASRHNNTNPVNTDNAAIAAKNVHQQALSVR